MKGTEIKNAEMETNCRVHHRVIRLIGMLTVIAYLIFV